MEESGPNRPLELQISVNSHLLTFSSSEAMLSYPSE